jgi:hypothetical protein
MIKDKYSRRKEERIKSLTWCSNPIYSMEHETEWVWNKDEIAWVYDFYQGRLEIAKVRMTGERWLTTYKLNKYPIYQYELLEYTDDKFKGDNGILHKDSSKIFEDLQGLKKYIFSKQEKYIERQIEYLQKDLKENKQKILEFTKKFDKNRPEKLKRILK